MVMITRTDPTWTEVQPKKWMYQYRSASSELSEAGPVRACSPDSIDVQVPLPALARPPVLPPQLLPPFTNMNATPASDYDSKSDLDDWRLVGTGRGASRAEQVYVPGFKRDDLHLGMSAGSGRWAVSQLEVRVLGTGLLW